MCSQSYWSNWHWAGPGLGKHTLSITPFLYDITGVRNSFHSSFNKLLLEFHKEISQPQHQWLLSLWMILHSSFWKWVNLAVWLAQYLNSCTYSAQGERVCLCYAFLNMRARFVFSPAYLMLGSETTCQILTTLDILSWMGNAPLVCFSTCHSTGASLDGPCFCQAGH